MAGDTFDAGTVYAEARLDRDTFQKELDQLRKDMAAFEREQFTVKVGMDTSGLDRDAAKAKKTTDGLNNAKANPKVGADTKSFTKKMFDVRATLKQIHEIVSTPLILVDIIQAMTRVAKLKYELRDLSKQYILDVVIWPQAFREINAISDSLLSMKNVARVAIPSLLPLLGAVAGGATVVASSLAGAGLAAGIFALGAIPLLTGVVEKSKEIEDAQKKVTEAITDEQRKTALRDLELALGAVAESEKQAVADVGAIKEAWRQFQTSIQPAVFGVLHNSVSLISKLLPALVPVVESVARVMNGWIDSLEAGIDSGGFKKFTDWLAGPGTQSLDAWGRSLGNFVTGFVNILAGANAPTMAFNDGLLTMSTRFREWSESLATNQQFQEWMRFTQAVMPDVLSILGQLLPLLWEIHSIFAPITETIIGFVAGFMEAHPALTKFLVVGFVVSQFFMGLIGIVAGIIIKILLFAAIFGRIGSVMAIGRTAVALWGAVMARNFASIGLLARSLITQLFRLTAIGRIFAMITRATQLWAGAQWLLNAAMYANPIGLIIAAIVAVIAIIVLCIIYWDEIVVAVTKAWDWIVEKTTAAWDAIMAAIKPALDWMKGAIGDAVDWIVNTWNTVVAWFEALPGRVADFFVMIGQAIADGATAAWNWLTMAAETAFNATMDFLAKLPGRIAYGLGFLVGTLWGLAVDGWNAFTEGISIAWNATVAWFEALPGRVAAFFTFLGEWLSTTAEDGWNAFTEGLATAWAATVAWFKSVPGWIEETLADLGAWFAKTAEDGWNGFTSGLAAAWEATIAWLLGVPDAVATGIGDLGEGLSTAAEDGWAGFTSGLASGWDATIEWLSQVPGWVGDFFVGAGEWLWDAGIAIWDGLIGGLGAAWDAVVGFFGGLIDEFVQGFKDAMGIASPSTLFFEFGGYILEGLLNGLMAFAEMVLGWIVGFGQMILDGFNTAISFLVTLWDNFWRGLPIVAEAIFTAVRDFVFGILEAIGSYFGLSTEQVRAIWDNFWSTLSRVATTIFNAIMNVVDFVWGLIKLAFAAAIALLTGNWDTFWVILRSVAETIFGAIQSIVETVWGAIRGAFETAISFLSGTWSSFWEGLKSVASTVFGAIGDVVQTVIDGIVGAFEFVVSSIGRIWSGIKSLLAKPINFMIGTVYNGGIVKAWNFVADLLPGIDSIGTIAPIPEFAKGGPVPRDMILRAGEAGAEYMLSAPAVRALGGLDAVDQMHKRARSGQMAQTDFMARRHQDRHNLAAIQSGRLIEGADHNGGGYSTSGFGGVAPHVAQAGYELKKRFGIGSVGGVGSRPNASDHPRGLALDFMTSGENGTALANHVIANKGHYAVTYAIWRQRINSGGGWKGMENRGSPTANHMDHVHVSFSGNGVSGPGTGDTSGGFVQMLLDQVREIYNSTTAPIPAAIRALVGPPPPPFKNIPPAMAELAIKNVGDFLFGEAEKADAGGDGIDPTRGNRGGGGTFDQGGLIQPGWNAIFNGTGRPELAGRLDQWRTLIDSERVQLPGEGPGDTVARMEPGAMEKLNGTMSEVKELLERRGAGATINIDGTRGNPMETARAAELAIRMS